MVRRSACGKAFASLYFDRLSMTTRSIKEQKYYAYKKNQPLRSGPRYRLV